MKKRKTLGFRQLVAAGFKVLSGTGGKWYRVVAPNGDEGCVLRQSANKWHFFWDSIEATASGGTPETCQMGGLGDVIGTDGELRSYERMLLECPEHILKYCAAAYRASSDVYNSKLYR